MQQADERTCTVQPRSRLRIVMGVFFLVFGVAIIVKAALTTRDVISFALGALLIVNGAMRLRPGAST